MHWAPPYSPSLFTHFLSSLFLSQDEGKRRDPAASGLTLRAPITRPSSGRGDPNRLSRAARPDNALPWRPCEIRRTGLPGRAPSETPNPAPSRLPLENLMRPPLEPTALPPPARPGGIGRIGPRVGGGGEEEDAKRP